MRDHIVITLAAVMLVACGGGGGGQNSALPAMPDIEVVSIQPSPAPAPEPPPAVPEPPPPPVVPLQSNNPYTWGAWASFNQGYFRVEETMWSATGSDWRVHGTPSGSVDNLPQGHDGNRFEYTGSVWGRVYEGRTGMYPYTDLDDGDRVRGQMRAVYETRDRHVYNDDYLTIFLTELFKELPSGTRTGLPWMSFQGDVGTNRYAPDYDPALDIATFTLQVQQYDTMGREQGAATGSFYGPNGEALAATFWYRRAGHRIEGAFGGKR